MSTSGKELTLYYPSNEIKKGEFIIYTTKEKPDFKFDEGSYIDELHSYIEDTYEQHYAKGKHQATEIIFDSGYAEGFLLGNILKYWKRYGKKKGRNRQDILKMLHYTLLMLYSHDHLIKGD